MTTTNVIMPQLGESVVEGKVSRWLKQVGDRIEEFEPLLEVSTDKVDTEVPAPASGIVQQILVPEGETVERGVLLAVIGEAVTLPMTAAPSSPVVAPVSRPNNAPSIAASSPDRSSNATRYSPVVMRMANEHNLDLTRIAGTGLGGRVTKKDVEDYLSNGGTSSAAATPAEEIPPWEQPVSGDLFKPTSEIFAKAAQSVQTHKPTPPPAPTPAPVRTETKIEKVTPPAPVVISGDDELVQISGMRRAIADHMVLSKLQTSPHVTTVFEIDLSTTLAHQSAHFAAYEKMGLRLTLTAYFMVAAAKALAEFGWVNSQWTDQGVILHKRAHIGMAVAIPDGLIVPVIRDVQDLSLTGVVRQVNDLTARARAKKLKPDEVTGGTFTITNHGVSGSLLATPIINQPQAAILGTGAMQKRVVVVSDDRGDVMAIRPMMYATLTFDHRLIDGATGDGFMKVFKKTLETFAD
jgi:2-oxoglutarate dehydrogenase E2 component (dihydrolipoamide succinyltransferase)